MKLNKTFGRIAQLCLRLRLNPLKAQQAARA